jgi:hypothetical protein
MAFNNKLVKQCVAFKGQVFAVFLTVLSLLVFSLPAQAFEIGGLKQKGGDEAQGYSLFIANNFSRKSNFYWSLGVSRYDDVSIEWNESELIFPLDSAEVSLSYRHQLSSRNPANRRLTMEYQLGVASSLTENKFTWPELNEEKFFSEKGDLSGFLAISAHYNITSKISAIIGVKHHPKMFEFGSMSSVFFGFKVNLSSSKTYYGN